jgi:hypothetical protein
MGEPLSALPEGVELNELARAVFDVLAQHTAFPWPVLSTQAKRLGVDLATLTRAQLVSLIPLIAASVGRFTSPAKQEIVRRDLAKLC